jgi:hypothetical protein
MPAHGLRKATPATTKKSGIGSNVPEEKLVKAANLWLDQEEKFPKRKPSAIGVAKGLGLSVAPEWLDTPRFTQTLEVIRFERKIRALAARPEIANTISELISLGLLEAQRRLILDPGSIPATVLYGDILHKWPKMLHDFQASADPVAAGDVFQTIVYEINMVQDPRAREQLRTTILGELNRAALALNPVETEVVDAETSTGDVLAVVDDGVVDESVHVDVPEMAPGPSNMSVVWDDPALD